MMQFIESEGVSKHEFTLSGILPKGKSNERDRKGVNIRNLKHGCILLYLDHAETEHSMKSPIKRIYSKKFPSLI